MRNIYDIAIIGGGIHGAGVAQAGAAAGYRVILLEKHALASGSSSRSSKLIHGGLRYLESAQFTLVRESLHEREILLRIAPHLVELKSFYIPVYTHTKRRPWQLHLGLGLYAILGKLNDTNRYRHITAAGWPGLDGLTTEGLQHVFQYYDAQTDDAKLTRAVMQSAQQLGAEMVCPAEFIATDRLKTDFQLQYKTSHGDSRLQCRTIVNAGGPWVNSILARISSKIPAIAVDLVQGSHILIKQPPPDAVYYVEAPEDHRLVFIMPYGKNTLVGTTEHIYHGEPEKVVPLTVEIEYLLNTVRGYFPHFNQTLINCFSGLRVLPRTGNSLFHKSRETTLYQSADNPEILSIYGGKLTAYRSTAEKVISKLAPCLPLRTRIARTDSLVLG